MGAEKKCKIRTIFTRYNNTLDNLINSLDAKFLNKLKSIDKGSRNILKFKSKLIKARPKFKSDFLNKNILDKSL